MSGARNIAAADCRDALTQQGAVDLGRGVAETGAIHEQECARGGAHRCGQTGGDNAVADQISFGLVGGQRLIEPVARPGEGGGRGTLGDHSAADSLPLEAAF